MDRQHEASEHVSLPVDGARAAVGPWAWVIACGPLALGAVVVWYLATWTGPSARGLLVVAAVPAVIVGSTVATLRDIGALAASGVVLARTWAVVVLLLYPLGAPAYLVRRTRRAGTTALVPVAFFVSLGLLFLAPSFVPA